MLLLRHTRRREFITLFGGAGAAWPLAVRAQHGADVNRLLFNSGILDPGTTALLAFAKGLNDARLQRESGTSRLNFIGQSASLTEADPRSAPSLRGARPCIVSNTLATAKLLDVKAATTTIPIVFTTRE